MIVQSVKPFYAERVFNADTHCQQRSTCLKVTRRRSGILRQPGV
jgi:hypothetical protein